MAFIDKKDTVPIPQVPGYPLVGNMFDVNAETPMESDMRLAKQYGEIYSLDLGGNRVIHINTIELLSECCDEKRFVKQVPLGMAELRHGINDGLFTARFGERNWDKAHRILVPAFGPLSINGMFDDMKDIASQLVMKWARHGPSHKVLVTDDFTRLTLDTISLCAMDYRFNSFYSDKMHPFINAMNGFLSISEKRAERPAYLSWFYQAEDEKFQKDIKYMRDLSYEIIQHRIENPRRGRDLLDAMLTGKDPQTGESLTEDSIVDNLITFLIAGHETTSGMLSFLFYYMLKNPEAYRKAQQEVDSVIGKESMQLEHLKKLKYIPAMLRETLRLEPTATVIFVGAKNGPELLGGKYYIEPDVPLALQLSAIHRDPAVYGEDADKWKPERMLDEEFAKLPKHAWKPFGNGSRACIGRPFAWQEAMMAVAIGLQYFNFSLDDPAYELEYEPYSMKPRGLYIHAKLRHGWTPAAVEQSLKGSTPEAPGVQIGHKDPVNMSTNNKAMIPLRILYGSNSGTCEAFAQTLAADAAAHGFESIQIASLDTAAREEESVSAQEPVVIITASYEGKPTNNAAHFFDWLSNLGENERFDTSHAVFSAGHSDWKATFHRIPTLIDEMLIKHGSKSICERGSADAANNDMLGEFQTWEDQVFWPAMEKKFEGSIAKQDERESGSSQTLTVDVSSQRASYLRSDVSEAKVNAVNVLTAPGVPEKRHLLIKMPSNMTYRAGDYLAILPLNPPEIVKRALARFNLPWDSMLQISSTTAITLPTEHPISANDLFSAYVELSQPATRRNISMLLSATDDETIKRELSKLTGDSFSTEITAKRVSLLDLLERYSTIRLPLPAFISSLINMRVRQYSISSSPLADPHTVSLTYGVLDEPALSGQGRHRGVASTYLAQLQPGDVLHVAVRKSHESFHLPSEDEKVPIIMVGAGTGLAPFRGFLQERAVQIGAGRKLAPAHLYIGCRHPDQDLLYGEEMEHFENLGVATIHRAFSGAPELSGGNKYVGDALKSDLELLDKLWDQGARVYVCGSRHVGEAVRSVAIESLRTAARAEGKDDSVEQAEAWFDSIRNERYSTDVFD
ncbi:NADPH--cytochrome P450 reductase [Polychaeton citri CBS 116435]|uniref:Bifunctional cytochrome P450/NADPH--P450 reductase n=1 Tax=Polychaeton citri CBS 116435 TaxID=1314669 RepID=A0A9P4QD23_9PEZI|nr:NADPH--cytochrome P450 reductase [Polychaeton citri CBS 116435]